MRVTPCECQAPGWCQRHRCEKTRLFYLLCGRYRPLFELWEAGRGPGQERSFAQRQVVEQMGNCRHRRAELRRVECPACFSRLLLKVFGCEVHTECTLAKPLPGIACCMQCPDHTAADEEAQTASAPEYVE